MPRSPARRLYQTRLKAAQRTVPVGVKQIRLSLADNRATATKSQLQSLVRGSRVKVETVQGQWLWLRVDSVEDTCDNPLHARIIAVIETRPDPSRPYALGDKVHFQGKYVFVVDKRQGPRRLPRDASQSPRDASQSPRDASLSRRNARRLSRDASQSRRNASLSRRNARRLSRDASQSRRGTRPKNRASKSRQ